MDPSTDVICCDLQYDTPRPQNTQLYVRETEDLMEGFGGLGWNPFEEWWAGYLNKKQ